MHFEMFGGCVLGNAVILNREPSSGGSEALKEISTRGTHNHLIQQLVQQNEVLSDAFFAQDATVILQESPEATNQWRATTSPQNSTLNTFVMRSSSSRDKHGDTLNFVVKAKYSPFFLTCRYDTPSTSWTNKGTICSQKRSSGGQPNNNVQTPAVRPLSRISLYERRPRRILWAHRHGLGGKARESEHVGARTTEQA
jgi:hypothetical protein